jgi:hypothetical protein
MRSKSRSTSSAPTLSKAHKHFQSAKRTLAGASPTSPSLTPRNSGAARPGTGSSLSQSWSSIGECIDTPHVIGKQCPGPNSGDSGCILVSRSRLHEETTPVVDSAAHDLAHAGLQTSTCSFGAGAKKPFRDALRRERDLHSFGLLGVAVTVKGKLSTKRKAFSRRKKCHLKLNKCHSWSPIHQRSALRGLILPSFVAHAPAPPLAPPLTLALAPLLAYGSRVRLSCTAPRVWRRRLLVYGDRGRIGAMLRDLARSWCMVVMKRPAARNDTTPGRPLRPRCRV